MSTLKTYKANRLKPLRDKILVVDMEFNERLTTGGIIIPGDDARSEGIRPRWGRVFAVGPKQHDVEVGEYILVKHGRWTRGVSMEVDGKSVVVRMVDNKDILLASPEYQSDMTFTEAETTTSNLNKIHGSLHNDGIQEEY